MLLQAAPNSRSHKGGSFQLYPFMMASINQNSNIDVLYQLLLFSPDLVFQSVVAILASRKKKENELRLKYYFISQSFHSTCLIRLSIIIVIIIIVVVIIHTKYMIQPTTTNFQFWFEIMIRTFFTLFFPSTTTILLLLLLVILFIILLIHSNLKLDWN